MVLRIQNLNKFYGEHQVLHNIHLDVKKGEIHALIGENGAGKSTLMNILFGMPVIINSGGYQGEIEIMGKPIHFNGSMQAIEAGIGMVHQEFMLLMNMTVWENVKLGREDTKDSVLSSALGKKWELLDDATMQRDCDAWIKELKVSFRSSDILQKMPVSHLQMIEIIRELDKTNLKLLVLDEPTAVLTELESKKLMESIKKIAETGISIIFISHHLKEVMDYSDRISVMRDGHLVGTYESSKVNEVMLAEKMMGKFDRSIIKKKDNKKSQDARIAVKFKNFSSHFPGEEIKNLDLDVFEGEILGIAGMAGQGKLGIVNGLLHLCKTKGEVEVYGKKMNLHSPGEAYRHGMAFVSEDRKNIGLLLDESIENNLVFAPMQLKNEFLHFGFADRKKIREFAKQQIELFDVRCQSSKQNVKSLSGGNQQKICLAKALALHPNILFVSEPTRGIDIGAKQRILQLLKQINQEKNMAIVIVSSELEELRSICDRIAVINQGKVHTILQPEEEEVVFGLAMSGIESEAL